MDAFLATKESEDGQERREESRHGNQQVRISEVSRHHPERPEGSCDFPNRHDVVQDSRLGGLPGRQQQHGAHYLSNEERGEHGEDGVVHLENPVDGSHLPPVGLSEYPRVEVEAGGKNQGVEEHDKSG